jgi:hypothetical protein
MAYLKSKIDAHQVLFLMGRFWIRQTTEGMWRIGECRTPLRVGSFSAEEANTINANDSVYSLAA